MKLLIAMNAYKGCLSSSELSNIIEKSILSVNKDINIRKEVIADGGDGFLELFSNFKEEYQEVEGPLKEFVNAKYLVDYENKEAVIEIAEIVGLKYLSDEKRNPYKTSTRGIGKLIKLLLEKGIKNFYIGLGGSATNDCGLGMLHELGIRFLDFEDNFCINGIDDLSKVEKIDLSRINEYLKEATFNLICDVDNPLYGKSGATYIYSKQKGLKEEEFEIVDQYIKNFSKIVNNLNGKNFHNLSGSGAAGGLAYAFLSFTKADLIKGSQFFIDYLNLESKLEKIDLLITGEGKLDSQSFRGKAPIEVAKVAKKFNKKVMFLAGNIDDEDIEKNSFDEFNKYVDFSFSINRNILSEKILDINNAKKQLELTTKEIFKLIKENFK